MSRSEWTQFLQQQGAELNPGETSLLASPNNSAAGLCLIPLLDQGILSLTGPEAEKYLQGQVTCDLNQLSTEQSLLGSNCTPKGNVISVFRLIKLAEESLLLRLPRAILEPALANLKKFIVFSKAEIADTSTEIVGLGIQGDGAGALIESLFGELPAPNGAQIVKDGLVAVRVPGERFEIWGAAQGLIDLWHRLTAAANLAPAIEWQRGELAAGLVQLNEESLDTYLPQMLNLQAVEGVSFDKGCYTGQEVVARMQFRGKLKKLTYRARVDADAAPKAGMSLHTADRKSVGKVLAVVPLPQGGYELQAVINKGVADRGGLRLEGQDGPEVTLLPLPYAIDPELFERPAK